VGKFVGKLGCHGGLAPAGRQVCCDKLLASMLEVREPLPQAETFLASFTL